MLINSDIFDKFKSLGIDKCPSLRHSENCRADGVTDDSVAMPYNMGVWMPFVLLLALLTSIQSWQTFAE